MSREYKPGRLATAVRAGLLAASMASVWSTATVAAPAQEQGAARAFAIGPGSLTEALDIEWRAQGIRVVDVLPLFVNTAMVTNEVSRMKTVQRLGVRLGPDDVAQAVWRLANQASGQLPVHTFVGMQTRAFALLSKLSPGFMNRWVTARLAGY